MFCFLFYFILTFSVVFTSCTFESLCLLLFAVDGVGGWDGFNTGRVQIEGHAIIHVALSY